MIRRTSHPQASVSTRRVEAYTDGVFAIAATLLILDLTTRSIGEVTSDTEMWDAIVALWQPLLAFAVSFLLLCLVWTTHIAQFEHIARINGTGVWINNVRLLFTVLVPFTSALSTDYESFQAGRVLLPINFFLIILLSWFQWLWAARNREVVMPDLTEDETRAQGRGSLSAVLISLGTVALSPFIGSIAFCLFFFDGLLTKALGGTGGSLDFSRRPRPDEN